MPGLMITGSAGRIQDTGKFTRWTNEDPVGA
jgi:hypothetical protein